ncbi:hypothetical protein GUJ93_ZPchr0009g1494 [Zizania palustris]|uniref:BRX domain-containing protein n=1 Tax=Zizania palustris TaxID=103762 RepID=A0A8J5S6V4_ZIZPA|nr:hypothetical protein GUJ93_ZPchr0009g1494 [Zizania palustris]
MHACFHGGAKITKSINVIRDFTKILMGGGGGDAQARRRPPEADGRRRRMRVCKDTAAAAASAKIAPAQLQEEADGDRQPSHMQEEVDGGGKKRQYCDKCCSALLEGGGTEEAAVAMTNVTEESGEEWVAEPEPGVLLTLAPRPDGATNRLVRIRFREELFDAWAAQSWWADNHDRIVELYSVVQPNSEDDDSNEETEAAMLPATPCQSEEEEASGSGAVSRLPSTSNFASSRSSDESAGTLGSPILGVITAPTTSGATAPATGAAEDEEADIPGQLPTAPCTEWVEEYESGVFITVRAYPGQRLQLRHVELRCTVSVKAPAYYASC